MFDVLCNVAVMNLFKVGKQIFVYKPASFRLMPTMLPYPAKVKLVKKHLTITIQLLLNWRFFASTASNTACLWIVLPCLEWHHEFLHQQDNSWLPTIIIPRNWLIRFHLWCFPAKFQLTNGWKYPTDEHRFNCPRHQCCSVGFSNGSGSSFGHEPIEDGYFPGAAEVYPENSWFTAR